MFGEATRPSRRPRLGGVGVFGRAWDFQIHSTLLCEAGLNLARGQGGRDPPLRLRSSQGVGTGLPNFGLGQATMERFLLSERSERTERSEENFFFYA